MMSHVSKISFFLRLINNLLYVCVCVCVCIHITFSLSILLLMDVYLFPYIAIENNAAINTRVQISLKS